MYVYVIECSSFSAPCVCRRPPRQEEVIESVYLHTDSCELPCVDAGPLQSSNETNLWVFSPSLCFVFGGWDFSFKQSWLLYSWGWPQTSNSHDSTTEVLELQAFAALLYTFTGAQYLKLGKKGWLNGWNQLTSIICRTKTGSLKEWIHQSTHFLII